METSEVIERIRQTAVRLGLKTTQKTLLDRPTVIARRSDFKLRWFATRLHTFLVAAAFDEAATTAELDSFLEAARDYAADHKGGLPRGLQTGSAAIAVAVVRRRQPHVESWASEPHGRRFAALSFPAVADLDSKNIITPKRMLIGGIYAKHLRSVVHDVVQPALEA